MSRFPVKAAAGALSGAVATILLFVFSDAARDGAAAGLILCARVLIPSLFVFLCLCEFFVRSGAAALFGKIATPAVRFLFALSGPCAAGVLMSYIGGYPMGARSAALLRESKLISAEEARRMTLFCVNAGPGFLIFAVGDMLLGNRALGWMLFAAHAAASLTLGVLLGLWARRRGKLPSAAPRAHRTETNLADALVRSVASASSAMIGICAFAVFFSALSAVVLSAGLPDPARAVVPPALEITSGLASAARYGSPTLLAFAVSFGGLSVHFQVISAAKDPQLSYPAFFAARLLHGGLATLNMLALCRLFPRAAETFSNHVGARLSLPAVSIPASVAMIAGCLIFLWDWHHKRDEEVRILT